MAKILAIFIGLALLVFVGEEVIRTGSSFARGDASTVAEVNGEKIDYKDFSQRMEASTEQFKQQYNQPLTPQVTDYIQSTTWNQLLTGILLKKEIEKLGLVVGEAETSAMVSGNNPDQQIQSQFVDETGKFDKAKLNQFLTYINSGKVPAAEFERWGSFVKNVIDSKRQQKYVALVSNGLYVNSLEAQDDYTNKNKLANFKYTVLDYATIPDSKVTVTDDDYNTYYNEHKGQFKNPEETRSFEYVSFNAAPSKQDSASIKEQVDKLAASFKASTNDSLFVQINAETKAPLVFAKKGQLEPKLDSVMFTAEKGAIYGPYLAAGKYKIAKLIDTKVGPDSVKARHILLNPATEGGMDKAVAKADSLKKLIQGGKSFDELAKTFSIDKNSAVKGGDLGTFGRGAMIPAFEDAAFDGKTGDLVVVKSQYGVHLLNIESQKGSTKVVKVAVVDKTLTPSSETQNAVYAKAQQFLSTVNSENFAAEAKKAGLTVKSSEDVTGVASSLLGLDNARPVVKWAFGADKGAVSDQVFAVGDQYIVARLSGIKPQGVLPLDAVKKQIAPAVMVAVKGKQLAEKLQAALSGATTIDQVAQKAGGKVVPVQNIVFANPVIPGASAEYALVGSIFGSQINKLSAPVKGQSGVYVYSVESFANPAALTNTVREKQQLSQILAQRTPGSVLDALKDKANVKDNRAKFL